MKVSDAVQHMTKSYLHRIIDSFTRDFPKPEEERARSIITKNVEELSDCERICRRLLMEGKPYSERVFQHHILEVLLNQPGYRADEEELVEKVGQLEQEILDRASDADSLRYEEPQAVDVLQEVLSVAVQDDQISLDELRLIRRLREKLGVSETAKKILLARLGHFPRRGNTLHTPSEYRDALNDLQRTGVLFYCNRLEGGVYVIPEEVVPGVKEGLGFELGERSWSRLLEQFSVQQLADILNSRGLPQYGRKDEKIERIISAGIMPSEALSVLSNNELYELCKALPGANVSGTKNEKVQRVIDYFANLVIKEVSEEAEPGELYFEYLVELAHRDRENLLANSVISKDRDMDAAFEEGARWLFENRFRLERLPTTGSDHCDGCIEFRTGGDLLMWDTKSKEGVYTFPASHVTQFKRYVRDSLRRVSCFLVIVPEVGDGVAETAARLKIESKSDTDVAVIAAEDLKWLAENWADKSSAESIDPEIFNVTGVLDRPLLESRVRLLL